MGRSTPADGRTRKNVILVNIGISETGMSLLTNPNNRFFIFFLFFFCGNRDVSRVDIPVALKVMYGARRHLSF